jgi:hypothetical protein
MRYRRGTRPWICIAAAGSDVVGSMVSLRRRPDELWKQRMEYLSPRRYLVFAVVCSEICEARDVSSRRRCMGLKSLAAALT